MKNKQNNNSNLNDLTINDISMDQGNGYSDHEKINLSKLSINSINNDNNGQDYKNKINFESNILIDLKNNNIDKSSNNQNSIKKVIEKK